MLLRSMFWAARERGGGKVWGKGQIGSREDEVMRKCVSVF